MNFLIVGLGNFGVALAVRLTQIGHEVIGVDSNMSKVELLKNDITHTICANCTDYHSARELPVKEADVVIICIGEDNGNSIMATAIMKQLNAKRIIGRAVSDTQETVLHAMGIDEIVHPEQDSAEKLARKLTTEGLIDSFDLSPDYSIVKIDVPERYEGKVLSDTDIRSNYDITVLAIFSGKSSSNFFGIKSPSNEIKSIAKADSLLGKGDIMVVFGKVRDIEKFLQEHD
ncbi:MAG: TrkA family potassium uptake protein [Bacteroidales bacterium]|nr:TrkA family potassium uptake protein [Bacteroidales bacterium]MDT8430104.1 TrkA family potassium uptake protein [Bacteroidales bacterium]